MIMFVKARASKWPPYKQSFMQLVRPKEQRISHGSFHHISRPELSGDEFAADEKANCGV